MLLVHKQDILLGVCGGRNSEGGDYPSDFMYFMDSRFKKRLGWISHWVKKELKIIPDKKSLVTQLLSNFW